MDNYGGGHMDWIDVETTISTSSDQIAVAPGSLVREWQHGERRYFQYKLDHASLGFYSFISARYEVAREDWNGIKLEVYYLKDHPWNVPRMMNSIEKSLDYFTKNFGPYYHKEARIIEFPRVADLRRHFLARCRIRNPSASSPTSIILTTLTWSITSSRTKWGISGGRIR